MRTHTMFALLALLAGTFADAQPKPENLATTIAQIRQRMHLRFSGSELARVAVAHGELDLALPEVSLVGGDFNTNPYAWQNGLVPLVGASAIADTDQAPMIDDYMSGLGFTNPTVGLGITEVRYGIESRLDAVYARGVEVVGAGVERSVTLSDHYPTWIDVRDP